MKLLHLSPVLFALLVACSDTEAGDTSSTIPNTDGNSSMKPVSFTPDKTSKDKPSGPDTHTVSRTGIKPSTKTVKGGGTGGKTEPTSGIKGKPQIDERKPSDTTKDIGTKTVKIKPDSKGKPDPDTKGKPDSKGKPDPDTKGKPTTDKKDKPGEKKKSGTK